MGLHFIPILCVSAHMIVMTNTYLEKSVKAYKKIRPRREGLHRQYRTCRNCGRIIRSPRKKFFCTMTCQQKYLLKREIGNIEHEKRSRAI